MRIDRATLTNQNGAIAAYTRDAQHIPAIGIEGYIQFKSDNPGTSQKLLPKLDFSWMVTSIYAENTNVEPISYQLEIFHLNPGESLILTSSITVSYYAPNGMIITPEMQLRLKGVNSLKSLIVLGKPVDILDKHPF